MYGAMDTYNPPLGMSHDSGWSQLSHHPQGPSQYGFRPWWSRRFGNPRRRRMMRRQRALAQQQAAAQAEYDDYMRGGWGTPGWATSVAPGYQVPGTYFEQQAAYYGLDGPGEDAFHAEIDAILAEEDALEAAEVEEMGAMDRDLGAISGPSRQLPAQYGAHGYGADPQFVSARPPNHFVDSFKMGAGIGLGFLAVGLGASLLLGGPR